MVVFPLHFLVNCEYLVYATSSNPDQALLQ